MSNKRKLVLIIGKNMIGLIAMWLSHLGPKISQIFKTINWLPNYVGLFHVCDYHRSISTMFIILLFFNLFCLFSVEVHVCFLCLFLLFCFLLFYFLSFPQRHNSFFFFFCFVLFCFFFLVHTSLRSKIL